MKVLMLVSEPSPIDGARDYVFECPACGNCHGVRVGAGVGPRWSYNGLDQEPTFSPSLRVFGKGDGKTTTCHLNVTNGQLVFHADCPHDFAGKTVPMVDMGLSQGQATTAAEPSAEATEAAAAAEVAPQPEPKAVDPNCPFCHGTGIERFKAGPNCEGQRACLCVPREDDGKPLSVEGMVTPALAITS